MIGTISSQLGINVTDGNTIIDSKIEDGILRYAIFYGKELQTSSRDEKMVFSANAQYVNNTFDNISVGVNAGSVAPVKPGKGFWEAQRPNFGLEVTKQVNPVVALAVEGETNVNTTPSRTAFDQAAVYGLGKWNLSNLLFGYHGCPRLFEVEAVTGAGWGHNYCNLIQGDRDLNETIGILEDIIQKYKGE